MQRAPYLGGCTVYLASIRVMQFFSLHAVQDVVVPPAGMIAFAYRTGWVGCCHHPICDTGFSSGSYHFISKELTAKFVESVCGEHPVR
jgi:hypothetical protein